jgi:arabinogalactan oligomer/maltooligosaccharide transport system substrate-binding protein
MKRTIRAGALLATLAIAASVVPATAQSPAPLAYQGEITFWNTMRDFEFAKVQEIVDEWTAMHPGITVKHELVPFDGARDKYSKAAQAGNAPDILRADIGWTIGFANDNVLLDLTPYLTDAADWLPVPVETATWQGKVWGLPSVTDALGLQCNKKLLAEAGLDAAPATWQELVDAGTKVTDLAAQKYGFYTRGDSYWAQPFIWSWGGTLYEVAEDGTVTVTVNSPESAAGWNFLKDNIVGKIMPATWDFANDYTNQTEGFKAGTIMCVMNGPWQVADHLTGAAFKDDPSNLVIAPIPTGEGDHTGSPVGGHNYVVYAGVADDPDRQAAVLDFLNYLDSTQSQVKLANELGLLPTRLSAYADPTVVANPVLAAWGNVMAKATNRAGHPKSSDMYVPFSQEYQAFLIGDKTAEQALESLQGEWETLFQ